MRREGSRSGAISDTDGALALDVAVDASAVNGAGEAGTPGDESLDEAGLEARFAALVERWRDETAYVSSPSEITHHPAYEEIIRIGSRYPAPVLRLIFAELERRPALWFDALQALTGQNPVRPENIGRLAAMTADWLEVGRRDGYV